MSLLPSVRSVCSDELNRRIWVRKMLGVSIDRDLKSLRINGGWVINLNLNPPIHIEEFEL